METILFNKDDFIIINNVTFLVPVDYTKEDFKNYTKLRLIPMNKIPKKHIMITKGTNIDIDSRTYVANCNYTSRVVNTCLTLKPLTSNNYITAKHVARFTE